MIDPVIIQQMTNAVIGSVLDFAKVVAPLFHLPEIPATSSTPEEATADQLNVTLDHEMRDLLKPLLIKIGYDLRDEEVQAKYGLVKRTLTVAASNESEMYFLQFPKGILTNGEGAIYKFMTLRFFIPKDRRVFLLSPGLESVSVEADDFLENEIRGDFIPWGQIQNLIREEDEARRVVLLRTRLRLQATAARTAPPTLRVENIVLTAEEKNKIVQILVSHASDPFANPKDVLQNLIEAAHFPDLSLFKSNWSGDPESDARKLVNWTTGFKKVFPVDHERAGESTLGWLLKTLLAKGPSPSDQRAIQELIRDHHLLADLDVQTGKSGKVGGG